ncbi:MAG: KH domain-containing protein [Candidatus Daviesbacteria bacterium]
MKDLLDYIVKSLVSKPDEVVINEESEESTVNLSLSVAPEDMGIVIGKGGQTIQAIRKLLISRSMAERQNLRVNLNLQEVK